MPTTDDELAKKGEQVQKLREQVAMATAQRVEHEATVSNDIAMAQLNVEEARLQAQLDAAKRASKVSSVRSGASAVLDVIKEDKANADAYATAAAAAAAASSAPSTDTTSADETAADTNKEG